MPAMTMPYEVQDRESAGYAGAGRSDQRQADRRFPTGRISRTSRRSAQAPLEKPPAEAPKPPASSGFELLKTGEAVPDGTFVDQDGKARRFGAFKGAPVVMTFIYTAARCRPSVR